jgi:phosphodiesterase/alkaline phosphatase D-like protein
MSELILGPLIGGLSHNRAFVWGRADGPAKLYAWLGRLADLSDAWLAGESLPLTAETGYAGVAPLHDLQPETHYYYALTLQPVTPQAPSEVLPGETDFPGFQTFPQPGVRKAFAFAFGSSILPGDPNGGQTAASLYKHCQNDPLRFILLVGDQVYADAYPQNGLNKIATGLDDFRETYLHSWSRPALHQLFAHLPAFMILDEHEAGRAWHWNDFARQRTAVPLRESLRRLLRLRPTQERSLSRATLQAALQANWEHQGMHAPPAELAPQVSLDGEYTLQGDDPGSLAYTFTYGGAAFFVLDLRTWRVHAPSGSTLLGGAQWKILEDWLLAVKDLYPVKFLISSSAFLMDRWPDLSLERWSAFPQERARLLSFLAANDIEGVYILTGGLRAAYAVHLDLYGPQGKDLQVWEFASSPLEHKGGSQVGALGKPLRSGLAKRSTCTFKVDRLNYGVVQVGFQEDSRATVHFLLYGADGKLLASAGD